MRTIKKNNCAAHSSLIHIPTPPAVGDLVLQQSVLENVRLHETIALSTKAPMQNDNQLHAV